MAAELDGKLWEFNVARVLVVDVTDDYREASSPMPVDCYPVIAEVNLPKVSMPSLLMQGRFVDGFLYDWHQSPREETGTWYVGVVDRKALTAAR